MKKILLIAVFSALCCAQGYAQSTTEYDILQQTLGQIINSKVHSDTVSTVNMKIVTDKQRYLPGETVSGVVYFENVGGDNIASYFGTVTKSQIQQAGFNWADTLQVLLNNKWVELVNNNQEFRVIVDVYNPAISTAIKAAFGDKYVKINPMLAASSLHRSYFSDPIPLYITQMVDSTASERDVLSIEMGQFPKRLNYNLPTNVQKPYYFFRFKLNKMNGAPLSEGSYLISVGNMLFKNVRTNKVNVQVDDSNAVIFVTNRS